MASIAHLDLMTELRDVLNAAVEVFTITYTRDAHGDKVLSFRASLLKSTCGISSRNNEIRREEREPGRLSSPSFTTPQRRTAACPARPSG